MSPIEHTLSSRPSIGIEVSSLSAQDLVEFFLYFLLCDCLSLNVFD